MTVRIRNSEPLRSSDSSIIVNAYYVQVGAWETIKHVPALKELIDHLGKTCILITGTRCKGMYHNMYRSNMMCFARYRTLSCSGGQHRCSPHSYRIYILVRFQCENGKEFGVITKQKVSGLVS